MAAGEVPLFKEDGTKFSCGIKPKELKPDSGVAEAEDGVEVFCSK